MQTICLFGADYASSRDLHQALKDLLCLPEYYGMNADALNDCLSELVSPPALWIRRDGTDEVRSAMDLIAAVFRHNGCEVKEL